MGVVVSHWKYQNKNIVSPKWPPSATADLSLFLSYTIILYFFYKFAEYIYWQYFGPNEIDGYTEGCWNNSTIRGDYLGGDFGRILRASKTILALRYVLADKKLFWKGFGVRYGDKLVS